MHARLHAALHLALHPASHLALRLKGTCEAEALARPSAFELPR